MPSDGIDDATHTRERAGGGDSPRRCEERHERSLRRATHYCHHFDSTWPRQTPRRWRLRIVAVKRDTSDPYDARHAHYCHHLDSDLAEEDAEVRAVDRVERVARLGALVQHRLHTHTHASRHVTSRERRAVSQCRARAPFLWLCVCVAPAACCCSTPWCDARAHTPGTGKDGRENERNDTKRNPAESSARARRKARAMCDATTTRLERVVLGALGRDAEVVADAARVAALLDREAAEVLRVPPVVRRERGRAVSPSRHHRPRRATIDRSRERDVASPRHVRTARYEIGGRETSCRRAASEPRDTGCPHWTGAWPTTHRPRTGEPSTHSRRRRVAAHGCDVCSVFTVKTEQTSQGNAHSPVMSAPFLQ